MRHWSRILAAGLAVVTLSASANHAGAATAAPIASTGTTEWSLEAATFAAPSACPELARRQTLYRVCDDQRGIFNDAVAAARRDGKLLMVTFGSTWCATCKSFSGMLQQAGTAASPNTGAAAGDGIGSPNFTHVEIAVSTLQDGRRVPVPTGEAVLARVLAAVPKAKLRSVPFIAVIDPHDMTRAFARNLDDCETTAGGSIDGERVRQILAEADAHVRQGRPAPSEPGWLRRKLRRWFAI